MGSRGVPRVRIDGCPESESDEFPESESDGFQSQNPIGSLSQNPMGVSPMGSQSQNPMPPEPESAVRVGWAARSMLAHASPGAALQPRPCAAALDAGSSGLGARRRWPRPPRRGAVRARFSESGAKSGAGGGPKFRSQKGVRGGGFGRILALHWHGTGVALVLHRYITGATPVARWCCTGAALALECFRAVIVPEA